MASFWIAFFYLLSASFFAFVMSDSYFLVSFLVYFFYSGIFSYPYILKISLNKKMSYFCSCQISQNILINIWEFMEAYVVEFRILCFLIDLNKKKITYGVLKDSFRFSSVLREYYTKIF